jgi:lysyl-tRNA synthetase class I
VLQDTLPSFEYTEGQKRAFALLAAFMREGHKTGEEVHARLHELKTEADIKPAELFMGLYQSFLARSSGPKAGWFLSVLPREFVIARLEEAGR